MVAEKTKVAEFSVGQYVCPKTKSQVPLKVSRPLAFIEWPVVVTKCASCGEQHVLHSDDVYHWPVFGYE